MEIGTGRSGILLHSCCGPCSTAVIERLEQEHDLTVFYYNPNITNKAEYEIRKASQIEFLKTYKTDRQIDFIEGDYEPSVFEEMALGLEQEPEGGLRCTGCFRLRLEKTAILGKKKGFDGFCTTLSVSPHKNATMINDIGLEMERIYGIKYLTSDFKKRTAIEDPLIWQKNMAFIGRAFAVALIQTQK